MKEGTMSFSDLPIRPVSQPRTLRVEQVAASMVLPIGVQHPDFQTLESYVEAQCIARLTAFVLTDKIEEDTRTRTVQVPVTWWDHLKGDLNWWANALDDSKPGRTRLRQLIWRWLDKHPMKEREISLTVTWQRKALFPEAQVRWPAGMGTVVYHETASEVWKP